MNKIFTKYTVKLVKESGKKYEVENDSVLSPSDLVHIINKMYDLSNQCDELLILLCLDTKNRIVGGFEVSHGSLNNAIVHPREIFKRAIVCNSASIVIAHNHPSGDSTPSTQDISLTQRLNECGELLGIKLLDHVIIGDNEFTSLKEKRYL